ncbi:hypothetical protein [Methanorbis rubei]|uniref:Uncharacterized protein n=1 Tax=Methanorbis rubei TaxID=3028300 RepID=A0AAE4MHX0_9EURY|nr:hypothetical protein [Methanocorpusculaceae archaeon Cs1]
MKPLLPLILLLAILAVFTAGCILPPAETITENETTFNLSAVERDPVRESAAEEVHFPSGADELERSMPEYQEYRTFMNQTENATYFDYLVHIYPQTYQYYRNISPDMSFLYFLERYDTYYPYSLNHNSKYKPYRLIVVHEEYRDMNKTIITVTEEMINETPILSSYFVKAPGHPIKVLPEEEYQLDSYRHAYLEWNGTLYKQIRSIT